MFDLRVLALCVTNGLGLFGFASLFRLLLRGGSDDGLCYA